MTTDAASHQAEAMRLANAGRLTEAVPHFERARQLDPRNPVLHFNCGFALQQLNRLVDAAQAYRTAIELAPGFFDAWNNLSAALKAGDQVDAAVIAARQAVALRPNSSPGYLNLGNALKAAGDWRGAENAYRQALAIEPSNPRNQLNLANTLREMGRIAEAMPLFREAVRTNPSFAEAHRDLAFAMLLSGDLQPGWIENEWRWQTPEMARQRRQYKQPAWNGESLAGRTVLVYTEQGFGDAIQFVRYVPLIAARGGRVILECQPALARLFRTVDGTTEVVIRGEELPAFDLHVPLLNLPRIFGTSLQSIPASAPYLRAPGEALAHVSNAIPHSARRNIGLVWAGNPSHLNDRNRSLPPQTLRPLFELSEIEFYSLQVSGSVRGTGSPIQEGWWCAADLSGRINDYADTAALIDRLDLVISVDTSVAHLAGAMAKPIWLLLPFAPDWRWMLGRDDSPWYPTMRLFRQPEPKDWAAVIHRVADALRKF